MKKVSTVFIDHWFFQYFRHTEGPMYGVIKDTNSVSEEVIEH